MLDCLIGTAVIANPSSFMNKIVTTAGGSQITGNGVFNNNVVGRNGNSSQNFDNLMAGSITAVCDCSVCMCICVLIG